MKTNMEIGKKTEGQPQLEGEKQKMANQTKEWREVANK